MRRGPTYRRDPDSPVEKGRISELAHCVGGTFLTWAGVAWRFRPDDFEVLSKEGPLGGASLADWPMSYDDMVPFYEKAERDFGVAGGSGGPRPGVPGRKLPMAAHPQRVSSQLFMGGARKLGYLPFPIPIAVNSKNYGGRPRCRYRGACRGYGCPISAKASSLSISLPRAQATANLDLRPDAMVFELPVNDKGLVTGARYFDSRGDVHEVRARHTIVAFLADPKYGGNKDYAGWRVAGYPGAPRGGFTAEQMQGEAAIDPVWKKSGR